MELNTDNFTRWLETSSIDVSTKIAVKDLLNIHMGRGVVATEAITKGDTLFTIPRSGIFNISTCLMVKDKPAVWDDLLKLGQWLALVVALLYEVLVTKDSLAWKEYFGVLPFSELDVTLNQLMFWTDEELARLLPSLVGGRIDSQQAELMFEAVTKFVADHKLGFEVDGKLFHRVATTIMSYSFDVERPDYDAEAEFDEDTPEITVDGYYKLMVALADTLNADTEFHNAHLEYTPEALVMKATKDISAGDQVFNTYADHSNSEILRRYGYVQPHGSQFDFGEIPLEIIRNHFNLDQFELVQQVLAEIADADEEDEDNHGICHESYDCFATGEVEIELILFIQVLTMVAQLDTTDEATVKRIYKKCYQLVELKRVTELMKKNFLSVIGARLKEYEGVGEGLSKAVSREEMAEVVKAGEKRAFLAVSNPANSLVLEGEPLNSIEDAKLLRNLIKKREGEDKESERKRKK